MLQVPASVANADIGVDAEIGHWPLLVADAAPRSVLADAVGDVALVTGEGSFESHPGLLIDVDDGPAGQLVQTFQGSVVR